MSKKENGGDAGREGILYQRKEGGGRFRGDCRLCGQRNFQGAAETIFEDMVSFAQYAFNKSHAAAYAVVSYETAYLKCHYPKEFMAALMSSVMGQPGHISAYIRNCNEMGIEVLPPSVLRSEEKFSVEGDRIRYGLAGIKNVGTGIVGAIIDARKDNPEPTDIYDFVDGLDAKELNRKAVES